jgi:hypothetical protein
MDPVAPKNDGSRHCPMCGALVAAADKRCAACGEAMLPPQPLAQWWDIALAFGIGSATTVLCGYWIGYAVQVAGGDPMERDISSIIACVLTAWFWMLPILAVVVGDPRSTNNRVPTSRWRLFWQAQGIMYAISIAFFLLCLATCAAG